MAPWWRRLSHKVEQELSGSMADLRPEEAAVLAFLQQRLHKEAQKEPDDECLKDGNYCRLAAPTI